jgi:hypothetical protein
MRRSKPNWSENRYLCSLCGTMMKCVWQDGGLVFPSHRVPGAGRGGRPRCAGSRGPVYLEKEKLPRVKFP